MFKFISSALLVAGFSTCVFAQGNQTDRPAANQSTQVSGTRATETSNSHHLCYARSPNNEVYGGKSTQLADENCRKFSNAKCSSLGCDNKF